MDRVVSCVICTSFVNAFVIGRTRTGVIWQEKGDPSKAVPELVILARPSSGKKHMAI